MKAPAKRFLIWWLPPLVWMGLIFYGSSHALSGQNTSPWLGGLIRSVIPNLSDESVRLVILGLRKCAHLAEYGILSLLLWRARRGTHPWRDRREWSWPEARFNVLISACYAASDELHQAFVPSRVGSPLDVMIDATGAFLAMFFLFAVGRRRGWWAR